MNTVLAKKIPNRVRPTVSLEMGPGLLADLVRTDLERSGFIVITGGRLRNADVLVTDERDRRSGRTLTVLIGPAEIEVRGPNGMWWFPITEIERLGDVLSLELAYALEAAS